MHISTRDPCGVIFIASTIELMRGDEWKNEVTQSFFYFIWEAQLISLVVLELTQLIKLIMVGGTYYTHFLNIFGHHYDKVGKYIESLYYSSLPDEQSNVIIPPNSVFIYLIKCSIGCWGKKIECIILLPFLLPRQIRVWSSDRREVKLAFRQV